MSRSRGAFLIFALLSLGCSPQSASNGSTGLGLDEAFERGELLVINDSGESLRFDVYLARDFEQRRRGLMFVRRLPRTTGMLFIYEYEDIHSMWMKNTYLSLDMVFARADGSVSSVVHNTEPLSLRPIASREPVKYVLELNAGVARSSRIGTGSRLLWPSNQSTAAMESAR